MPFFFLKLSFSFLPYTLNNTTFKEKKKRRVFKFLQSKTLLFSGCFSFLKKHTFWAKCLFSVKFCRVLELCSKCWIWFLNTSFFSLQKKIKELLTYILLLFTLRRNFFQKTKSFWNSNTTGKFTCMWKLRAIWIEIVFLYQ